jgi:hypothetical protein
MLSHNVTNKAAAIVAHCELLKVDQGKSSPAYERITKIERLALAITEMLQTRDCELQRKSKSLTRARD